MKLLLEFYDLKSKLLENEEKIIKDMQGNSIEEKNIKYHQLGYAQRGEEQTKKHSIESTQEDESY